MSVPKLSREHTLLLNYLNDQRRHVLEILDGMSEVELRVARLPSGWTPIGLVNHLAIHVEQFWFGAVVAGDPDIIAAQPSLGDVWHPIASVSAPDVLDLYRREISRADAILASANLDASPAWWPGDVFGEWRMEDVRQVILHVMTETAIHAGHLDAVRELTDGRQFLVLP